MSQRLIQPGLSGVMARPMPGDIIGYGKRGPIRLQAGGAPESEDDTSSDGAEAEDDSDDESDDSEDDDEDDKSKKSKSKKDDDDDEEVVPKWKLDKAHKRMTAADQRASALQKQIDELKASADVPAEVKRELEDVKSQVAVKDKAISDLTEARDKLTVRLAATTLKNAPDWEDLSAALKLADLSEVEVSDDGKVDLRALKSALNQCAKDHPYLVKKKEKTDSDTDQSSASSMNGRRKGQQHTAEDVSRLKSRFPVLGQR